MRGYGPRTVPRGVGTVPPETDMAGPKAATSGPEKAHEHSTSMPPEKESPMHPHGSNWLLLIKTHMNLADRALCADQDRWARELQWTVNRTGFGARLYRDPRFDLVREVEEVGRSFSA